MVALCVLLSCAHVMYRLYQNRIGDKGVIDMAPGLLKAQSLLTLRYLFLSMMNYHGTVTITFSLVENEISDSGAFALTEYLSTTNTLKEMRLAQSSEKDTQGSYNTLLATLLQGLLQPRDDGCWQDSSPYSCRGAAKSSQLSGTCCLTSNGCSTF